MFENLGKRIQTFFLVLIIVLLSVVMGVVGFGTPSGEGCNPQGPGYAATVYGETITTGDFNAAYIAAGFADQSVETARAQRLREYLLEGLIERELLVREAERLGFTVEPEEVMRRIAEDEVVLLTGPVDAPPMFPSGRLPYSFRDRDGKFSTDRLRRFIQFYLRRSIDEFAEWQVRETLAQRVRDAVTASVTVSPREVWDAYVAETERASISYVRFAASDYRGQVDVTPEAVTEWMNANREQVDAEYQRQSHRYRGLEEQVRARHILLRVDQNASEDERAAKRAQAQELLRRAQAGEDFVQLARAHSDDSSAQDGGDLGWFPRGRMVAPFEEAAFSHQEPGLHGEVVESQYGFHVIQVLGRRSGDVPEDEAKREIAEGLYRAARAIELAREEANRSLAYLREGHSTDDLNEQLRNGWTAAAAEGGTTDGATGTTQPQRARAPQVNTTSFGRSDRALPGAFDSMALTRAAFEMTLDNPLPDEPLQLGDSWVVFRLDERTEATQEAFTDETRDRITQRLLATKRSEVLSAYIGSLRARAESDGEIVRNPEILDYGDAGLEEEDDDGNDARASAD